MPFCDEYKYTNIDTIDFQLSCVRCGASIIFSHASVEALVVVLHLFYHQQTHPVDMTLEGNEFIEVDKRPGAQVGGADPIVCPRPRQTQPIRPVE